MNALRATLLTTSVLGALAATAPGQVRLFMAADGEQETVATTGNTHVTMFPGTSKKIMVWLEDTVQKDSLNFYQVITRWDATPQPGATGSVSYVDNPGVGDSVLIDLDRGDYVFADGGGLPGSYFEEPPPPSETTGFGFIGAASIDGGGVLVSGIKYLGEFTLLASPDAGGDVEIVVVPLGGLPHGGTGLGNGVNLYIVDEIQNLTVAVLQTSCPDGAVGACCDLDIDAVRDDGCVWCNCDSPPECIFQGIAFADMGGAFAECAPDGFCNVHDRNHALSCFSAGSGCDTLNIDAGGPFGDCAPDGFCNVHDANHALSCFQGTNSCSCPLGPLPEFSPRITGEATLSAMPTGATVQPGERVRVRVFIQDPVDDVVSPRAGDERNDDKGALSRRPQAVLPQSTPLQSYQLHMGVSGGRRGCLELIDVSIELRDDDLFADRSNSFHAFNVMTGQMLSGLSEGGAAIDANAYLATFTYLATADALGTFVVDVLHDERNHDQTFLISSFTDKIEVAGTTPGVITVIPGSIPRIR